MFFPPVIALALIAAGSAPAAAQIVLSGTVRDSEAEKVIPGVRVEVRDALSRVLGVRHSDDEGRFRFALKDREAYRLHTSRIGYRATTTPVLWRDGYDFIHVEVRMDTEAVLLAPLEVIARSRSTTSPVLDDFHHRLEAGLGYFVTRAEVQALGLSLVSDVLARVPGVRIESSGRGLRRAVYMDRGTRNCPAQLYVDGILMNPRSRVTGEDYGFRLDDVIAPLDVEGIEVYQGLATVPAEFLSPEAGCGVVAIWTRRGN
ncbi:MAG: TonB-dependent receptor plug domain-containing protein [Gemmatimonadota bacterium]